MIHPSSLSCLESRKNLLAFSAGIDSTALFFLLKEHQIPFDLACVNYQTRPQSSEEIHYATTLANTYQKHIYTHTTTLEETNFEHRARQVRYRFFETIIVNHGYHNLILAHQLNDQLEWFLMQLSKGAGLLEMLGMQLVQPRNGYTLVRPLLFSSRRKILEYLTHHNIHYFTDTSNCDSRHKRNLFRHTWSNSLMDQFETGIQKSFSFLEEDRTVLCHDSDFQRYYDLFILHQQKHSRQTLYHIDQTIKQLGVLLSCAQKKEILRTKDCVVSGKIAIVFHNQKVLIAPYCTFFMKKHFKEQCRKAQIPSKIRPYLYKMEIDPTSLQL
jgi:tRNA(Ile)-lysidine synthase